MKNIKSLIAFILIIALAQIIGMQATTPALPNWYAALQKPYWNPPSWVFGPVWAALYLCIAISGWKIWNSTPLKFRDPAMKWWGVQMALNALWSPLFFGMHLIAIAAVDIYLTIIAVAMTIHYASMRDRWAAWLLTPYLLWILFASTLNIAILALNPA